MVPMNRPHTIANDVMVLSDLEYDVNPDSFKSEDFAKMMKPRPASRTGIDKNKLDLYLPTSPGQNSDHDSGLTQRIHSMDGKGANCRTRVRSPVVIFVHAGGWRRGDRKAWKHFVSSYDTNVLLWFVHYVYSLFANVGQAFAVQGIACAVVSYPINRLPFPLNLVESLTSFCMSVFAVGVVLFIIPTTSCACLALLVSWEWRPALIQYSHIFSNHIVVSCCTFLALCQALIWLFVYLNKENYPSLYKHLAVPVVLLPCMLRFICWCFSFNSEISTAVAMTLFTVTSQITLVIIQIIDVPIQPHPTQANAVVSCISWIIKFGHQSGLYDPDYLFLCGYSAGGHLVSLVTLDDTTYLRSVGLTMENIKGVISISGVHNLKSLAGGNRFLQELYLRPTFTTHQSWTSASPITHVRHQPNKCTPEFLVINAEHDFILLKDGEEFARKLKDCGFETEYVIIPSLNHFTLGLYFGRNSQTSRPLHDVCISFIRNHC